uniref:Uncharacterized protein n=1 Tax=Nelumbo nucifera TaxID=4432 RepID=A0A822ZJB0_NELNU|nr:TPA_asm: hypothetical protein HUJ06_001941 [Nelumbo nucifera]
MQSLELAESLAILRLRLDQASRRRKQTLLPNGLPVTLQQTLSVGIVYAGNAPTNLATQQSINVVYADNTPTELATQQFVGVVYADNAPTNLAAQTIRRKEREREKTEVQKRHKLWLRWLASGFLLGCSGRKADAATTERKSSGR